MSEKIVEGVISAEENAHADKKTGRENSSGGRFFDQADRNPNSEKQKAFVMR